MKNLSGLPAGTGPCSGSLPFHMWTEAQTCIVLDKIASNKAYFRSFILQSGEKKNFQKNKHEKQICLEVLRDTKWMEWMIRHDWIIREGNGHLTAKDVWHANHMAITILFKSILQPSAETIKSVLGPISSESDIRMGSRSHQIWTRWQESGKNPWYFKYVALQLRRDSSWLRKSNTSKNPHNTNKPNDRVLSFNDPAGFDSDDEGTYRPLSSVTSGRPAIIAKNKRKTQQDWPGRRVSDRITWSEYAANANQEKDIPPHLRQVTSSTITTPSSSNLIEVNSKGSDSDSESTQVSNPRPIIIIDDQFDQTMLVHTPPHVPPLDQSMIIAPVVDIARNIPLPPSPMLSATSLVETKEDRSYVDLVKVLCRILKLELDKKPSHCMDKTEIIISKHYYELYPYIPQLVTSLGGGIFIDSKSPKTLTCGVQRYAIDRDRSLGRYGSSKSNTLIDDGSPRLDFSGLFNLIRDLKEKELSPGADDNDSGDLLTF
ncbi:uncharacterized protein L199_002112 [Kwoniella botswanensis]|uniref:uncharacterized protein n=1 Tax=Kwoniella botswanensis TaxID=1268659 RepID=UPI00315CF2DB